MFGCYQSEEAMSNAELIERLNKPCGRTTGHGESCSVGWLCGACADKAKAADALELADKRIDELKRRLTESEESRMALLHDLTTSQYKARIARDELLRCKEIMLRECGIGLVNEVVLAQIGGDE
jgi:hypothetical protein